MLLNLAALFISTLVAADPSAVAGSHGTVNGTVTLTDADGKAFDAPGVRLTLTCDATPGAAQVAISDDHGTFRFPDVAPDRCSVDADLQGFASTTALAAVSAGETVHVAVHLDTAPAGTGIRVVAESGRSSCTRRFK